MNLRKDLSAALLAAALLIFALLHVTRFYIDPATSKMWGPGLFVAILLGLLGYIAYRVRKELKGSA